MPSMISLIKKAGRISIKRLARELGYRDANVSEFNTTLKGLVNKGQAKIEWSGYLSDRNYHTRTVVYIPYWKRRKSPGLLKVKPEEPPRRGEEPPQRVSPPDSRGGSSPPERVFKGNPGEPKPKRKSAWDIVMAIFGALPVMGTKSKTQIAREIGSKEDTVDDYLGLIMMIQGMPRISRESTGTRRYGYRRARAKKEG